MSDSWDNDDFEVKEPVGKGLIGSKWEGEDEEENVKESWEDFDEEEKSLSKDGEKKVVEVTKTKRRRNLKDIIAEKERIARQEAEELKKQVKNVLQTPEEIYADKLRQQKIQEDADLELARDTFGLSDQNDTPKFGIESMQPSSKEDFDNFRKALVEIMSKHENAVYYQVFIDDLLRDLCLNMDPDDIRKLGNTLHVLANEKAKVAKLSKGKKKTGKGKANLTREKPMDFVSNEYDDFI